MSTLTVAAVLIAGSGAALDHWFAQIVLFFRHLWELFVLWVRIMTAPVPFVGPLLAAHPGRDHLPDSRKHNRALHREFQKAKKEAEAEAERLLAETATATEDEAIAVEQVSEDPAEQLEKTQPFKPYLVKETA